MSDPLPTVSRLGRNDRRPARVLTRTSRYAARDRHARRRRQIPLGELVAFLISRHGLTEEVRQRAVCLYWMEIAGDRIAAKTIPESIAGGVLHVSVATSSWLHELQMKKPTLISQINAWVDQQREWLGPPPIVTDLRFSLAQTRRDRLVDPTRASQLRQHRLLRTRLVPDAVPPIASAAERDAIRAETRTVVDDELRGVIESIRLKWNR